MMDSATYRRVILNTSERKRKKEVPDLTVKFYDENVVIQTGIQFVTVSYKRPSFLQEEQADVLREGTYSRLFCSLF